ncbi:MAG: flagellar type III secretion system pore protein FliP [Gammaproteobacteria bacterium]|nr:flagellar type III secretion system pore protein FliP [Gammaproteobacteria bacterium]
MKILSRIMLTCILVFLAGNVFAQPGIDAISVTTAADGGQTYSLTLQALALMTALTLLPAGLLMLTSFTRIVIVLSILRTALGTHSTPTNHVIIGLSLFMTVFIMAPVFDSVYNDSVKPYLDETMTMQDAFTKAQAPFRSFMLDQTREDDIALFSRISGKENINSPAEVPFSLLIPAFMTSELKTAFQIGFILFIPFLIIDLVVASVLMAMGMMMLSPLIISLPFKIMLFVLIDGWTLIMGTLASSFYM